MTPHRQIDTLSVGELIQQLGVQKTTPTRFNIDLPKGQLANALYAAYAAEVRSRGHQLQLDDATRAHIEAAAEWLRAPCGKVGLMMTGLYGNGKTTLMMAMCNLINWLFYSERSSQRRSIRIVKAKDIAWMAIDKDSRRDFERLFQEDMLAIDEVGEEPAEIVHYGMVYTPIRDLLEERYARQKLTIITTNLVQSEKKQLFQIRDHYGERVVDRLREMMKIVPFHNGSYRQDKPATLAQP